MRHPPKAFLAAATLGALVWGCSTPGGCGALTPLGQRYQGAKTDNAVAVRLSAPGVEFLNQNWRPLLETFAPGQTLELPLGCSTVAVPVLGDVVMADQGNASGGGRLDGTCDGRDAPAVVEVVVEDFRLVPTPPDKVAVTLDVTIDSGKVLLKKGCIQCSAVVNTRTAGGPTNRLQAQVAFTIDTRWDQLLSFSLVQLQGTQQCGASGALGPPACLDAADLTLAAECGGNIGCSVCSVVCGAGNWDIVKNFLLGRIAPELETRVREAIQQQACEPCGDGLPACPQLSGATSTCDTEAGICKDGSTGKCVPRFLGIEGRLSAAMLLPTLGIDPVATLELSLAAGSTAAVDDGLWLGTRGGLASGAPAACVPPHPAPQVVAVPAPDFDAQAPAGTAYHVALGVSDAFLNLGLHHAHQSGALCLNASSSAFGLLSTGLFRDFLGLPSLGRLTSRDGKDAPMQVVVRPAHPPELTVGEGTYDPVTKQPLSPLLRLAMRDLTLDFYALMDERFVRLFSLTADVAIPLSLISEGCSSVRPALGDLKQMVTQVRTANSELLAEDPQLLATLVPTVMGLLEPALAQALQPIALPEVAGFRMKVLEAKGLGAKPGSASFQHLGLYAQLSPASAPCPTSGPGITVSMHTAQSPGAGEQALETGATDWPVVQVRVEATADSRTEYTYRVNGGLWSTYQRPRGGLLEVSHPTFRLQGRHTIEVRGRSEDQPQAISAPVAVEFTVDVEPPRVRWVQDDPNGPYRVEATDNLSGPSELQYAFARGGGAFGAFGASQSVGPEELEDLGRVEVEVQDAHGNRAQASLHARPNAAPSVATASHVAGGCSAAGGGALWALGVLGWVLRLRRRRA